MLLRCFSQAGDLAFRMQETTMPEVQLAAAETLCKMCRNAEVQQLIADVAVPGLVALMCKSADEEGSKEAARLLAVVSAEDGRLVTDAFLNQLATLLEVQRLAYLQHA